MTKCLDCVNDLRNAQKPFVSDAQTFHMSCFTLTKAMM